MMDRRNFLRASAAGLLAGLSGVRNASAQMRATPGAGMGAMMRLPSTSGSLRVEGLPLRRLALLANRSADPDGFEATLVAAALPDAIGSGATTELWAFNNQLPGPLIELREGQHATLAFANHLDLDSTIHWHGLAVPANQDGNPMDPVAAGASRLYEFDVPPGSAGTYWYHPHAHRTTTLQVGHGLAGPLIVRSDNDPLDHLPERTLMITGLAPGGSAQMTPGSAAMRGMAGMGLSGSGDLLVNGQNLPVLTLAPGATQRWRIINATADRYLRLALDGHRFAVVGTDGGLLGRPLSGLTEWLLAPAQRVEIAVTVEPRAAARYALRDLGTGGAMGGHPGGELMTVATNTAAALAPVDLPGTLRPVADLGPASFRQQVVLSGGGMGMGTGMGAMGSFLINGRTFAMDRVDLETVVGRVELWDLVNATFMDHPIHIHGTQFQVVGRTLRGLAVPAGDPAWLDTVNVPAGETVTIKTCQTMPGGRMFHCHILPHEDAGMMGVLDVRPA